MSAGVDPDSRCPLCNPGETLVLENEHCLFLQEPHAVLVGSGIIVPRMHRPNVFDLTPAEWAATYDLLQEVRAKLVREHAPVGFNVGWNIGSVAGQEIDHAHLHVIPRHADEPYAGRGIRHWLKQPENKRPA